LSSLVVCPMFAEIHSILIASQARSNMIFCDFVKTGN
jgi:hypothetical protein